MIHETEEQQIIVLVSMQGGALIHMMREASMKSFSRFRRS